MLATCKDTTLHNPSEAVKLAAEACLLTGYKQPGLLDTLAAAYGAAGSSDKAAETSQRAFELASSESSTKLGESTRKGKSVISRARHIGK